MSAGLSWIGVKTKSAPDVLLALDFESTDRRISDPFDVQWAWGISHTGWLILHCRSVDFSSKANLSLVSESTDAVGVMVDDDTLVSSACGFRNGVEIWRLEHDPTRGVYDLGRTGQPPPEFRQIADRLKAAQDSEGGDKARVDHIFDVPIEVADAVCGYRHDGWTVPPGQEPPPDPDFREMTRLRSVDSAQGSSREVKRGFFSRLFGRR